MGIPGAANPLLLRRAAAADTAYQIEKSLRFDAGDTSYLSRSLPANGNRRTWTYSTWYKNSKISDEHLILNVDNGSSTNDWLALRIEDDNKLTLINNVSGSTTAQLKTNRLFRDTGAWMHIVIAVDTTQSSESERIRLYINGEQETSFATSTYPSQNAELQVNNSSYNHNIGFEDARNDYYFSGYLADTQFIDGLSLSPHYFGSHDSAGNWNPKKFAFPTPNNDSSNPTWSNSVTGTSGWSGSAPITNGFDGNLSTECEGTTNGETASLAISATINKGGVRVYGAWTSSQYGTIQLKNGSDVVEEFVGNASGAQWWSSSTYHGEITAITFKREGRQPSWLAVEINGVVLVNGKTDPTTRSNPNNGTTWSDQVSAGSGLTNATNLFNGDLSNSGHAGNGSYIQWVPTGGMTVKSSVEIYWPNTGNATSTLQINDDAGTNVSAPHSQWTSILFTGTLTKVKVTGASGENPHIGAIRIDGQILIDSSVDNSFHLKFDDSTNIGKNSLETRTSPNDGTTVWSSGTTSGTAYGTGDDQQNAFNGILSGSGSKWIAANSSSSGLTLPGSGVAFSNTLKIYGEQQSGAGNATAIVSGTTHSFAQSTSTGWTTVIASGGGTLTGLTVNSSGTNRSSIYAVEVDGIQLRDASFAPYHFDATNLTESATDTTEFFNVITWSGTGSNRSLTGVGFQPDFAWIKCTTDAAGHRIFDSVRGSQKSLKIQAEEEDTTSEYGYVSAYNADGVTLTNGSNGSHPAGDTNHSGRDYVGWFFKAGGAASSNSDGDITSSVNVSSTGAFSIVTWTSDGHSGLRSVGHGLGKEPDLILVKNRSDTSNSDNWQVYFSTYSNKVRDYLFWNNTDAKATSGADIWGTTSSTFSFRQSSLFDNGEAGIAYCFANSDGLLKVGSYAGSSSTVSVTTGFTPKFVMTKCHDVSGQEWVLKDSARGTDKLLIAEGSDVQSTARPCTFTANGFEFGSSNGPTNYNGRNYYYLAIGTVSSNELDVLNDTPTNYEESDIVHGNFCTPNPLQSSSSVTFSQGNLELDGEAGGWYGCGSTMAVQTGLWYWEATAKKDSSGDLNAISIGITDETFTSSINVGYSTGSYGYSQANGNKQNSSSQTSYGTAAVENDVISVAFDANNGKLWFGKNGTWFASGNPATGANAAFTSIPSKFYTPMFSFDRGKWIVNFGAGGSFKYTPPTDFKSLCAQNLDDTFSGDEVNDPSKYFDVKTYTGSGAARSIVTDFSPDLVWIKQRSGTQWHYLIDSARGNRRAVFANANNANYTTNAQVLTSLNSNGFSLGTDSAVNDDGETYVNWNWDAGAGNDYSTGASVTWASGTEDTEQPLSQVFNGYQTGDSGNIFGASSGSFDFTYTPPSPIAFSNKVRVWTGYGSGNVYLENGGSWEAAISSNNNDWVTLKTGASGTITKLRFTTSGNGGWWAGVEVDDTVLTNGSTPSTSGSVNPKSQFVNTAAGFSISLYTATGSNLTVGHGLNAQPAVVITKDVSAAKDWLVMHEVIGVGSFLKLNESQAKAGPYTNVFTSVSSSTFGTGDDAGINTNGNVRIAYCFAPIAGYSAFGSYEASGSSGLFVHLGFKPAFLMIKGADHTSSWNIRDNKRDSLNPNEAHLVANGDTTEATQEDIDFVSNGFVVRSTDAGYNSSDTFVYCAWAEHPFKTARAS